MGNLQAGGVLVLALELLVILALPPELCVHWWRIQCPNGPTSIGKCQKCGREKEYSTPYMSTYGNPQQKFPKITLQRAEDWDE